MGCVVPPPAATMPPAKDAWVAVLSGEMPPPIDLVARHGWIIAHVPGEPDRRFEYGGGGGSDPFADFTGGDIQLHGTVHGTPDEIRDKIYCFEKASREESADHPGYFPIPGPNSNTYVDYLLRRCKIPVELPATAIGRDYRGIVGASVTESRTGVQLETPLFGLRLGLVDGIEIHFISFVFGLHFWPPGITVPVNPGRIGFAADGHHFRPHEVDLRDSRDDDDDDDDDGNRFRRRRQPDDGHDELQDVEVVRRRRRPERRFGLGSAWLSLDVARPIDPAKMGGLEGRGTLGMVGRGLFGKRFGYGFGLDFAMGMGWPTSFAYSMHLYPTGFGVMFGPTGYLAVFAGVGTSGVTTLVEPALELPLEARFEVDVTKWARIGLLARTSWNVGTPTRQQSALGGPAFDEVTFGAFTRLGKTRRYERQGYVGSGYFLGLERRELVGSAWLGVTFGVESDAAF
jgi:hypothetical protein